MRELSSLEASVISNTFGDALDPNDLEIEFREMENNGTREGTTIVINQEHYDASGLTADSTLDSIENPLDDDIIFYPSIVIHEATHIWQEKYSLFGGNAINRPRGRYYRMNPYELQSLTLGYEQHASAVQGFFVITWQLSHGAQTVSVRTNVWPARRLIEIVPDTMSPAVAAGYLPLFGNLMSALRHPHTYIERTTSPLLTWRPQVWKMPK